MNAVVSVLIDPAPMLALSTFLASSGSALSPGQAAACAIKDWLASRQQADAKSAPAGPRGYRWKCLFLPEMTQIRMVYKGRTYHAQVIGDDIVYDGQRVSPRQMTLMIAGDGRNAWRDLLLRFPGDSIWSYPMVRRNAMARQLAPPQEQVAEQTAADTISAAAAAMSQALKAALELVARVNAESEHIFERRTELRRRTSDVLADDCRLD